MMPCAVVHSSTTYGKTHGLRLACGIILEF